MKGNSRFTWLGAGTIFAALWASAATATKIGLTVSQPLVIAVVRFAVAAVVMLFIAHAVKGYRLPQKAEWKQIAVYGLLNITIYLGLYVVAMQTVSAGIGSLAIATNPVYISFISVFFLKRQLTPAVVIAIIVCIMGVLCAAWPLFGEATVTPAGLIILLFSMVSYSVGAIYFSAKQWDGLSLVTINGWQTLLGGLFLLPFAVFFYKPERNHLNNSFWIAVAWLAIPVSIIAVQLWLWLLQTNAVRAGLWLFLCPLFGFVFAAWWMKEPISVYTIAGVVLVIAGLLLSKVNTRKNEVVVD